MPNNMTTAAMVAFTVLRYGIKRHEAQKVVDNAIADLKYLRKPVTRENLETYYNENEEIAEDLSHVN